MITKINIKPCTGKNFINGDIVIRSTIYDPVIEWEKEKEVLLKRKYKKREYKKRRNEAISFFYGRKKPIMQIGDLFEFETIHWYQQDNVKWKAEDFELVLNKYKNPAGYRKLLRNIKLKRVLNGTNQNFESISK